MAEIAEGEADIEAAIAHWRQAAEHAVDRDTAALSWGTVGTLCLEQGKFDKADDAFATALNFEDDPEGKAALLYDRLHALLANGREEEAETVIEKALELADAHRFIFRRINLYMLLGDHNWDEGEYLEALKAYIVAMINGLKLEENDETDLKLPEDRPEPFTDVAFHMFDRLMGTGVSEEVSRLHGEMRKWLQDELGADSDLVHIFLWPFRAVEQLSAASSPGGPSSSEVVETVLLEEIRRTFSLDEEEFSDGV